MIRRIVPMFLLVLMACMLVGTEPVQAETVDDTFYCYGNTVHCKYPGTNLDDVDVVWEAYDKHGAEVPFVLANKGYITIDATELDEILVVQTVSRGSDSDSMTMRIIPLHVDPSEVITVEFIDDGKVVSTTKLNSNTVVRFGQNHVEPPNLPDRFGEVFQGWFTDPLFTEPFDPREPVLENTKVYSKWVVSVVPDGDVVIGDNILVTFHSVPGLTYVTTGQGSDWVSFDIVVKDGYRFHEGTIRAEVDGSEVEGDGLSYRIECTTDTDITIKGERIYSMAYELTNASVKAVGYDTLPSSVPLDGVTLNVTADSGYRDLSIKVYSDGTDVTASCVDGNSVHLQDVTGNILIVAVAENTGSETVGENIIVTFHTVPGLTYEITGKGDDWISFEIKVVEGYSFREGTVTAEVDGNAIGHSGNTYVLYCSSNKDVMISGDRIYTITYDLSNATVNVEGYDSPPTAFPAGGVSMTVSPNDGYGSLTIKVYSDGNDITAYCVGGDRVSLYNVSGDILVVANASSTGSGYTPMWWILVLVVAIGTVSAIVVVKRQIGSR